MKTFYPFAFFITLAVCFCNQVNADDAVTKTIRNISLDSANLLQVKYRAYLLPKANATQPPPYPLPSGMHRGPTPDAEVQSFDIILVKDRTEAVLGSFQQIVDPSIMEGVYTGERFAFFDSIVRGDTVHYMYAYKGAIHVVQLKKINNNFEKTKEVSLPFDIHLGFPRFSKTTSNDLLLIFSSHKNPFKENASGDFIETPQ